MTERLKTGDRAADAVLRDANGNEVSLATLWADGPVLLNFVRHFG